MEAWDFGPVVPCVYQKYKKFGAGQIPDYTEPVDCFLMIIQVKRLLTALLICYLVIRHLTWLISRITNLLGWKVTNLLEVTLFQLKQ